MNQSLKRAWAWFFHDDSGKIVIAQFPNVPLVMAGLAYGLRSLAHGRVAHGADLVFVGMIFVWAWLEITEGVNGFRRFLGVAVLFWIISSRI
jgi:hypothetical protein